ncbi:MAG: winged helix-turn-helix domain-containing protein [Chloroflexi bacterium]|nr:winged helix-turn-helix domain-containing protein [Chloroflexota bacterium]
MPGAAFAVDDGLTIVAWNSAAERALGQETSAVLGLPCYEAIHAVDSSGRPCYESCPLARQTPPLGWAHSRALKARWRGGAPVYVDCFLMRCSSPSSEMRSLGFVTPLGVADAKDHLRVLSALEAVHSLATPSTDAMHQLQAVVSALPEAAGAEAAELVLLDPETGAPHALLRWTGGVPEKSLFDAWPSAAELALLASSRRDGLIVFPPAGGTERAEAQWRWALTLPVSGGGQFLGILTLLSTRNRFAVGPAARTLFSVEGPLSLFLRRALLDAPGAAESVSLNGRRGRPSVEFHCFGQFRVMRGGQELHPRRFKRRKSLDLLKILVARRGRPIHREALVELLWPDADLDDASNNLRVVLHDLRHALEPDLQPTQSGSLIRGQRDLVYLERSDTSWIDVEEFERLARQFEECSREGRIDAALQAGRHALALYRGEYLEDEPYTDWCTLERERLREAYVSLAQQMVVLLERDGEVAEAIQTCRMVLAADALREGTHRHLMGLLWQAGRKGEALRQYHLCRELLVRELDVVPDEETESLYQAILGQSGNGRGQSRNLAQVGEPGTSDRRSRPAGIA